MKYIKILSAVFISLYLTTSCVNEIDNYDAPNGGVYGKIIDSETNELVPLPVQGSTGAMIRLMESGTNATKSFDFYAMHDGTFKNSFVFNCDYLITVNGPFVTPGEAKVSVKGQTEVNIPVTPYARIEVSASISGRVVSIRYQVQKTKDTYNTTEVYGYWNFAPGVDDGTANRVGKVTVNELNGTITFDLNNDQTFLNNLYKIQANGNKIYVRVGARTEGAINYSPVYILTVS